jgi:hypothetical protein
MALLEAVESSQVRVHDLRHELDRARDALDRTDAVLAVADDTLGKAEVAIVQGRRWAPMLAVAAGVVVVGVVAFAIMKRRRREPDYDAA